MRVCVRVCVSINHGLVFMCFVIAHFPVTTCKKIDSENVVNIYNNNK